MAWFLNDGDLQAQEREELRSVLLFGECPDGDDGDDDGDACDWQEWYAALERLESYDV